MLHLVSQHNEAAKLLRINRSRPTSVAFFGVWRMVGKYLPYQSFTCNTAIFLEVRLLGLSQTNTLHCCNLNCRAVLEFFCVEYI